ncbi:hypothetical protein KQI65_08105 [bacterium]|nr:hypothetical protein [bacterium]
MLGVASPLHAQAQDADSAATFTMKLIAQGTPDSVVLRWGFEDYPVWKAAGRAGFVIERAEIRSDQKNPKEFVWQRLTPAALHPFSVVEWKGRYAPQDSLAGAAVQALHGQSVVTSSDPFGSIVELHMQQENLMGFALLLADMRADLADGLGLRYVDRDVQAGKGYMYRLSVAQVLPDFPLDTAVAIAVTRTPEALPAIQSLTAEEGEKQVVLRWDRYEHLERTYGGYFIEESTDGGVNFAPRNDIPFMPVSRDGEDPVPTVQYSIHLDRNYAPVHYRIRGMTAFGQLSPPGKELLAMGRDKTAPKQPAIQPHEIVDDKSVLLRWEIRGDADPDLDGFLIAKSVSPEGPFDAVSDLLPVTDRSYIDVDVNNLPAHYYVVSAVDTAGNSRMSAPVLALFPDSIPPAIPQGLHASIDSSGVVRLEWTANEEIDLQGYRVFYANDPTHEFQQLTRQISQDTAFVDTLTLKTLSEEIYYKVTALDYNFNHSPFTEALMVEKPDIVPPSAPLIHDIESMENGVRISWHRSPTSDAADHIIVRRERGSEEWTRMDSLISPAITSFTDTSVAAGMLYEYAVYAYDDDGLRSPLSNIISARSRAPQRYAAPDNVVGTWNADSGRVQLTWSFEGPPCRFIVYRTDSNAPARMYHSLDSGVLAYEDAQVSSGTYKYALKAIYPDGGESALKYTPTVTVP